MLYKSKIPDRIFSENVASDVLEATIIELANIHIFSNKFGYTFTKNIVATAKYFNGKDTGANRGTDDKATGVFTRVDFMF